MRIYAYIFIYICHNICIFINIHKNIYIYLFIKYDIQCILSLKQINALLYY